MKIIGRYMGLLTEFWDRMEYLSLIEEGRDPVEILHHKYSGVPSDIIDAIISVDPTKKKNYSQWLLGKWDDEGDVIVSSLENGDIARMFKYYKGSNDIQLQTCPSVVVALSNAGCGVGVLEKSSEPTTILMNNGWFKVVDSRLANDFDIVYSDEKWVIAVPNTYEASCKLGENMYWCTAGGRSSYDRGRDYYDEYIDKGKLYINFDLSRGQKRLGKSYPFTRYQFSFESNQFMDLEDEPVIITEIGMSEGAIRFYEEEGYDINEYGNKEEAYNEWRGNYSYRLNNSGLYLCMLYDDEFRCIEPDDDTSFYVFSDDDPRDPLAYFEYPNPFKSNDFIIKANDSFCILRDSDNFNTLYLLSKDEYWVGYKLFDYISLGTGFVFAADDNVLIYVNANGDSQRFGKFDMFFKRIFLNKACTVADSAHNGRKFVEIVGSDCHSLYAIGDNGIECIIKKDMPVNGKQFVIDGDGVIRAKFQEYNIYGDSVGSGGVYTFKKEFENGFYAVSSGEGKSYRENIMNPQTREFVLDEWFDMVDYHSLGVYGVMSDKMIRLYSLSGDAISGWYERIGVLDKSLKMMYGASRPSNKNGFNEIYDIISTDEGKVIGSFKELVSKSDSGIVLVKCGDGVRRCFSLADGKYINESFSGFESIIKGNLRYFLVVDNGEKMIYDFIKNEVVVRSVIWFHVLNERAGMYIILKENDKDNVFLESSTSSDDPYLEYNEVLNEDADEIVAFSPNGKAMSCRYGDRYYVMSLMHREVLLNRNGTKCKPYFKNDCVFYTSVCDVCAGGIGVDYNFQVKFWQYNEGTNVNASGTRLTSDTPQYIKDMYCDITGSRKSVVEEFRRWLMMLNS